MTRWPRAAWLSVALTAVVLTILVGANVLASTSMLSVDLTRAGLNTLSPESVQAAKKLTSDLQVIGLFRSGAGNGATDAEALISLYASQSSHVK